MREPSNERPGETAAPDRRSVLQTALSGDRGASSRRGVVAGAVASVAAALGFAGTVAGMDPGRAARLRRVEMRYRSDAVALDTIRERGAAVLDLLASEGHLSRGDVAELGPPEVNAIGSGGVLTGHLAARTDLDEGELTVVVEPEAGRQYAVLDRNDGTGSTVFDPASDDGVQPVCDAGYACEGGGCVCEERVLQYCNGTCYRYDRTGGSCTSCTACGSPACGY